MSSLALTLVIAYALVVTVWIALHILFILYNQKKFYLGAENPGPLEGSAPLVSILLAARNEEAGIEGCVRSVLTADYHNFELIVIDDRSEDSTAAVVRKLAAVDPRVRLLQVKELPAGWTGKMNAVQQGLALARGEVILIMDADTRHSPHTLGAALGKLQRRNLALLSLLPRFEHPSFFSRLVQPVVSLITFFWKPLPFVNSKRKRVALGWGGFLMLRRQALEAVGGLAAVKDRFAADIALVGLVKQAGLRVRLLHAPELVSTYMYGTIGEMIPGWSRILRLVVENRPSRLLLSIVALWLFCLTAYPMIALGIAELIKGKGREVRLVLGCLGGIHLFLQIAFLARIYKISRMPLWYSLGHLPAVMFTGLMMIIAFLRSHSQQLAWRGTSYQLTSEGRAC